MRRLFLNINFFLFFYYNITAGIRQLFELNWRSSSSTRSYIDHFLILRRSYMIFVGIDVVKDKHDCFITNTNGEVLL